MALQAAKFQKVLFSGWGGQWVDMEERMGE